MPVASIAIIKGSIISINLPSTQLASFPVPILDHVLERHASKEHVIDIGLFMEGDRGFKDPESVFDAAKEALEAAEIWVSEWGNFCAFKKHFSPATHLDFLADTLHLLSPLSVARVRA